MPELRDGESVELRGSKDRSYTISRKGDVYSCTCPSWQFGEVPSHRRSCKHLKSYLGSKFEEEREELIRSPFDHDSMTAYRDESRHSELANAEDMYKIGKYDEALRYLKAAERLSDQIWDGLEYLSSDQVAQDFMASTSTDDIDCLRHKIFLKLSCVPLTEAQENKLNKLWSKVGLAHPLTEALRKEAAEIASGNLNAFADTFKCLELEPLYITALNRELHLIGSDIRFSVPKKYRSNGRKAANLLVFSEGKSLNREWSFRL